MCARPDRGSCPHTETPVPMTPLGRRPASVRNSVNGPTRRRRGDFRPRPLQLRRGDKYNIISLYVVRERN